MGCARCSIRLSCFPVGDKLRADSIIWQDEKGNALRISALIIFVLLIQMPAISSVYAVDSTSADSTAEALPGAGYLPESFLDTSKADNTIDVADGMLKSPLGALGRAALVPGWGQFYTGKYVRGTVSAILETGFFAVSIHYLNERNDLRDQLRGIENDLEPDDPQVVELGRRVKSRNKLANDYLAYGLTTMLLSMIDSYVSAHLYKFEDNFRVSNDGERVVTSLTFRF